VILNTYKKINNIFAHYNCTYPKGIPYSVFQDVSEGLNTNGSDVIS